MLLLFAGKTNENLLNLLRRAALTPGACCELGETRSSWTSLMEIFGTRYELDSLHLEPAKVLGTSRTWACWKSDLVAL